MTRHQEGDLREVRRRCCREAVRERLEEGRVRRPCVRDLSVDAPRGEWSRCRSYQGAYNERGDTTRFSHLLDPPLRSVLSLWSTVCMYSPRSESIFEGTIVRAPSFECSRDTKPDMPMMLLENLLSVGVDGLFVVSSGHL